MRNWWRGKREKQAVWETEEKRLRWCDVKSSVVEKVFHQNLTVIAYCSHCSQSERLEPCEKTRSARGHPADGRWNRADNKIVFSWRQNRFSTGEGQEIRINLSADYRSVTAVTCTSNKGQSTTKDYNVILQFLQMAGLLKTIFSLVGFKVSRCFPRQHVVIKGPNVCVLRLIYLFLKLKQ